MSESLKQCEFENGHGDRCQEIAGHKGNHKALHEMPPGPAEKRPWVLKTVRMSDVHPCECPACPECEAPSGTIAAPHKTIDVPPYGPASIYSWPFGFQLEMVEVQRADIPAALRALADRIEKRH